MKRYFFIFVLAAFFSSLFSFPTVVHASCVCYTVANASGDSYPLDGTEAVTDDEVCQTQCLAHASPDGVAFKSGEVGSEDSLADQAATQAANTATPTVLPEGTCTCYCGAAGYGASAKAGTYKSSTECKTKCDSLSGTFSVCASNAGQAPLANGLCWSEADCKKNEGAEWSADQPAECEPKDHYCYPPNEPVELAVHIGETTQTYNIGTYINVVYTYALGAAALIAIVMIMVGGAQYMMGSATGGEAITAAKTRITNAVTGLVLLFLVYVILYTVNPDLTVFKTIQMPKIKPSLFVQGSCADYVAKGYKVNTTDGSNQCGHEGNIYMDPNGITISQSCTFDSCSASTEKDAGCLQTGSEYKCMTCESGGTTSVINAGFTPSASACSTLTPEATETEKGQCVFAPASTLSSLVAAQTGDVLGSVDACVFLQINCSPSLLCRDYGFTHLLVGGWYVTNLGGTRARDLISGEENMYQKICEQNPCELSDGPCNFIPPTSAYDAGKCNGKAGSGS